MENNIVSEGNIQNQSSQEQIVIHTFSTQITRSQNQNHQNQKENQNSSSQKNLNKQSQFDDQKQQSTTSQNILSQNQNSVNNGIIHTPKKQNQISQIIINTVYEQRKLQNILRLKNYYSVRKIFYSDFLDILSDLYLKLKTKCADTEIFFNQVIEYFDTLKQTYKLFSKRLDKMNNLSFVKQKKQHNWHSLIEQGIKHLLNVKKVNSECSKNISEWIDKQFIKNLKDLIKNFLEPFQSYENQIQKIKKKYESIVSKSEDKIDRIFNFQKIQDKEDRKLDLLSEELELIKLFYDAKDQVVKWGEVISRLWTYVQESQYNLFLVFKQKILKFFQQMGNFNYFTELNKVKQYWQNLQINQQSIFQHLKPILLKQQYINTIKSVTKIQNLQSIHIQQFLKMHYQQSMLGNPHDILKNLFVKRFHAKIILDQKSSEENIIYSTVDQFLVFYQQQKRSIRNKMMLKNVKNFRVSPLSVCVNQKQKRLIIDNINRENLLFKTMDETDQFLYMTEMDQALKQQYLS